MYCTQKDLETRLSVLRLAELTNDTANATSADPAVVKSLISRAETEIDNKASQVYTPPLQVALTGTVTSTNTALAGTNTLFLTELSIGDIVFDNASGQGSIIDTITSNIAATVVYSFTSNLSSATLQRTPRPVWAIAVDFACYYAMERRFSQMSISQDWKDNFKAAQDRLQGIADQEVDLGTGFNVTSEEAVLVAPAQKFTFDDDTTQMSIY